MRPTPISAPATLRISLSGQSGMALLPIVLAMVIVGALIGAGMHLVGPMTQRMRNADTHQRLDGAVRSVIAWSADRGRLPTAAEFAAAAGLSRDAWNNDLVYAYDANLAAAASGGVCGRSSTTISANGQADVALVIVSGGGDFSVNGTPAASGSFAGNAGVSDQDIARVISLAELQSRAGCFDRTAGRLTLLNNEIPAGCSGQPYRGDLFAEGGQAPYTWTAVSLPAWMSLTQVGSAFHAGGSPPVPGTDTLEVVLADAAGSTVRRRFEIAVAPCGGPSPVSQWDFDEGAGPIVRDGAGNNAGRLMGDTAWSTDTPDGSGASLVFDGAGDYVRVSDHSSLYIAGEVSLMAWVKEAAVGQYAKVISRRSGDYFYFLGVDNGHPYTGIGDGTTYTVSGKSLLMSLNRWNHLTSVYDDAADSMFLHFDGTERMTTVPQRLPARPGVDLSIGADFEGSNHYFNGDLDDVSVYDRALTDAEIRGLLQSSAHPNRVVSYAFNGNANNRGSSDHDGTVVGATYTADRFGLPDGALRLDGASHVIVGDHEELQLTGGLTLTAWVREQTPGAYAKIISRRRGDYFYFLGVDNGRPYGGIGDGSSYSVTRKSIAMTPGRWHFVAFVYDDDSDRMQIFFDGLLDETTVTQSLPEVIGVDLTIGADFEGTRHFFTGAIDGVRIYNHALTVEQIRSNY